MFKAIRTFFQSIERLFTLADNELKHWEELQSQRLEDAKAEQANRREQAAK